jgi:light-regulated signal transduction histidine kinase (bacteriophytochrome)
MGELIDGLLRLSRVTRKTLKRESVDLSEIASAIVEELRTGEPNREVEARIQPGVYAIADRQLIYLALETLLSNAWKFTAKRDRPSIEFGAEQQEGRWVYFVRDNGAGYSPAYSDRLFQPFQRLHSADDFPGTGVGLTLAHRIVARHGGDIWGEGAEGRGATFFFSLLAPGLVAGAGTDAD